MFIQRINSQHRYDFRAAMECEHCGNTQELKTGYDDHFYHTKVIPAMTCISCNKNRAGNIPETLNPYGHVSVPHPDAPHGFNRNASHAADCYVCDCEGWEPPADTKIAHLKELSERADATFDEFNSNRGTYAAFADARDDFSDACVAYVRELIAGGNGSEH